MKCVDRLAWRDELWGDVYRTVNLGLAFLLEVAALAAFCWWGFHVSGATWLKVVLGIGAPVIAAIVWGLFAAPRAKYQLSTVSTFAVKVIVFGGATAALIASGQLVLGIVFAAVVIANTALIRIGDLDDGIAD
jgi:Protein of unknown function (DUF2568)